MAEEVHNEKKSEQAHPPVSPIEDDDQDNGMMQAVSLATPAVEEPSLYDDTLAPGKDTPRAHRGVRFEEQEDGQETQKQPPPTNPREEAEVTLIEAFPSIDTKVIKAVLAASGGQVEPAFNALLGMSDPDFQVEEAPPPKPPRPTSAQRQLDADEAYARQLAEQYYDRADRHGQQQRRPQPEQRQYQQQDRKGPPGPGEHPREYNFFDDELPEIQKNIKQGFIQTQSKVNKWISDFRKRIDTPEEDEHDPVAGMGTGGQRQDFGPSQSAQVRGILRNADSTRVRHSTDRDRYDADPRVLSGDFSGLELADEEAPPKPARPRPLANPDLFKPTPATPPRPSGPIDEVDALYHPSTSGGSSSVAAGSSSSVAARALSPGAPGSSVSSKSKKWQPLTSVAPAPETEDAFNDDEDDPFALGDEDDEKDAGADAKKIDIEEEATERLKKAASETGKARKGVALEESGRSGSTGTRDKAAEELLNG